MADVEKKEDKAEGEEEEELDCSVPEVVNKYQFAGGVANGEPPAQGAAARQGCWRCSRMLWLCTPHPYAISSSAVALLQTAKTAFTVLRGLGGAVL